MVFYFFLAIVCLIIIINILIIESKIEISIKDFNTGNIKEKKKKAKYKISLKFLNIKWIHFSISTKLLFKIYANQQIKIKKRKINIRNEEKKILKEIKDNKKIQLELKKIKPRIEKINLNATIGTKNSLTTATIVTTITILISNIIPHLDINFKECYYKINPIFNDKNSYEVNLDCIIEAKLVHIIYVIYLIKRRVEKNERTSNRKSYEYSYE